MDKLDNIIELKFKEYRIEFWERYGKILENEEGILWNEK